MKRLLSHLLAAAFALQVSAIGADSAPRPNIIVILGDDIGFSDLACYGSEIHTPNLDALAAGGVRFTQFYNTARCCPTRASLLTGLYPHQAGIGHMTDDNGVDGYRGKLNNQCVTLAEVLRPAGYRTYMCGKWHVTRDNGPGSDQSCWPLQRGFEKFYGTIRGGGNYYDPATLCRQNTLITPLNDPEYHPESFYYTEALTDNAIRYLQQHAQESPDKPFFLYLAYTAAHWPLHARESDIAKYHGKYDAGYEAVRAARFARQKQLGIIPNDAELSPGAGEWEKVKDKAWEARCMEVYAAQIDCMDAGIGRVVEQLRASGQLDNTLILFLQDNGGCAEPIGRAVNAEKAVERKPMAPDEIQVAVHTTHTRDGQPVRSGPGVMPGPADTYMSYGKAWANVSDTPFREYKHWTHEGGISTPLIAHWPKFIPHDRDGKFESQPGHLIDIMATCVDVARAAYPAERDGQKIKPMEGVSLRPAFLGQLLNRQQPLFWEHEGNRAVRDGNWKLVGKEKEPWELYDISKDRSEIHDLASTQPDRVSELSAKWNAYAQRADVLPLGAWRGKSEAHQEEAATPKEVRYILKPHDRMNRVSAPPIAGRGFTVTAKFDTAGAQTGVIVAHGGTARGYSLYLSEGKLIFFVRAAKDPVQVSTPAAISGSHTVVARLDPKEGISLKIDGDKPIVAPMSGTIETAPLDGLEVGEDRNAPVGYYATPNKFSGKIDSVVIELDPQ